MLIITATFKQAKILRCSTKKLNHIGMAMLKRFFALAPCFFIVCTLRDKTSMKYPG